MEKQGIGKLERGWEVEEAEMILRKRRRHGEDWKEALRRKGERRQWYGARWRRSRGKGEES